MRRILESDIHRLIIWNCTRAQREYWDRKFSFNIIDSVRVPAERPAGEYALSWRWDAEQTPQVWAACADITVTA